MMTDWNSIESVQKLALEQEKQLGPHHAQLADTLSALADLHFVAEDYAAAEPLYWKTLSIRQKALGENHVDTAASLQNLAELYEIQDRYAEAQRFYQWANVVRKNALLKAHSDKLDRTVQMEDNPVLPKMSDLNQKCPRCERQLLDAEVCMYCTQQTAIPMSAMIKELFAGRKKASDEPCTPAELPAMKPNKGPVNALIRADSEDKYLLDQPEISIGRHPNNEIVIMADKAVSRKHAKIVYESGHFYISDCNTINGTYVNSERIKQPTRLAQGDCVVIGNITLKATFLQTQN
jgi:tetratricopeptide (TPR) repeat protein